MDIAKKHSERLPDLKKKVEESRAYFNDNIKRFEKFCEFVYKTSIDDNEKAALIATQKPVIEFNILESLVSRLRGEFAKQQPDLSVRAADGVPIVMLDEQFIKTIAIVEAHLRAIFFDGQNDMMDYNIYSDLLAGGFSAMRVYTEYVNERSFEQNICVERVFDPCLTIWDPIARKSHKGDGAYCGELFPMTREAFKSEFGEEALAKMRFTKSLGGFDWSFKNEDQEIVLICDYYEKKNRKETVLKLSNGHTVTKKEYENLLVEWENRGIVEQPPVVLKERKTQIEYICRYRFCESEVLSYVETDYKFLPLVFVDGNSVFLRDDGAYSQMTRPYVYHGLGIQKLKNFAGQSLANELENSIQHRFMAAIESVPLGYEESYRNVQKADVLMYNHFHQGNPGVTLPPPQIVQRAPIPPEITSTFSMTDEMTQTILGTYDTAGAQSAPMSGIAFARSAIQSNNASVPYIVGYIKGLNRIAEIVVDLIPKYYRTPRSLPVMRANGKREFELINRRGSLYMNFDPNNLQVKVSAGVNFAIQKEVALQTIISLSQVSPAFASFFNEEGLPVLLDNIEIRGIDQLKDKADKYMEKQKQLQEQQMQQAQQAQQVQQQIMVEDHQMKQASFQKNMQSPSEGDVGMAYTEQQAQKDAANIAIKEGELEIKFMEALSKVKSAAVDSQVKVVKAQAEVSRDAVENFMDMTDLKGLMPEPDTQ